MSEPVVRVRGLHVGFAAQGGVVPAVRGVDFDVFPNEVVGIVGESGSGKSVTSLAITGLLAPNARVQGSIRLGDTEVTTASPETLRQIRGQDVGMVFQDPSTTLNPVFEVGRQVVEGQVAHGRLAPGQAVQRAVDLLREVDIPDPQRRVHQYPHQFSGGMRQRVVIAMAMSGQPRLIIADEPTTALDVTVQAQVLAVLARRQAETGAAVVLITHDLGVIAEVAHRVLVMYGGRIVESGPVDEIFAQPRHPYTVGLLRSMPRLDGAQRRLIPITGQPPSPADLPRGCVFHPRCAWASEAAGCLSHEPALQPVSERHASACHRSADAWDKAPAPSTAAEPVAAPTVRPAAASSEPLLQVQGLQVHFPIRSGVLRRQTGSVRAVDGVNLQVHAGETLGLVGESGCGKTTTGRAIMGLLPAAGGAVRFDGQDVTHLSAAERRRQRRHMQYVFQDPYASLNPIKTVNEIVAEPLRIHGLFEESGGQAWIDELLERVGLSSSMAGRLPSEFSGGQRQRIGIARALALKPRLLILDEPVAALDVSIQAQIVNLLQDLQQALGLAYIFIAHDLSVVRHIADRVAVMYLGRVVEEADKHRLYAAPTHPYTQSLLSAVPLPDPRLRSQRRRIILEGDIPNPAAPPSGCHFHPRCFRAVERCRVEAPALIGLTGQSGRSACHFSDVAQEAPR
ncbi:MAG: dipeptide ABC transporter ATP-binding protein [Rhodoferax sp.]|nr:dipeptide ABC transporter ATP-binding protein [Rhodoferax sp.]